ncbi:MAG: Rab family GTPase [Planctomycetota bacterium]
MAELQKKVCVLGAFAVGKTSLVGQFVHHKFSDKYLTTMGVKVDRKVLDIDGQGLRMLLWDLAGEDDAHQVRPSYLKGMSGYLLVADSTRKATLDVALSLRDRITESFGALPYSLLINKVDLSSDWELERERLADMEGRGVTVVHTSARTGVGVDEAFQSLGRSLLKETR